MKNYNNFRYRSVVGDHLWSSFIDQSNGRIYDGYATTLRSILPPDDLAYQFSLMPNTTPPIIADYFPNHPINLTPFEDLIDNRNRCFSGLHQNDDEPEPLRRENLTLAMADFELNMQLFRLQQEADAISCLHNYTDSLPSPSMCSVRDSFRRMTIGDEATAVGKKPAVRRAETDVCVKKTEGDRVNYRTTELHKSDSISCLRSYTDAVPSPSMLSVSDSFRRMMIGDKATAAGKKAAVRKAEKGVCVKKAEGDCVKLPKSISVRCNGFIKAGKGGNGPMGQIRTLGRAVGQVKAPSNMQKVYVHATEREKLIELEVYNQGLTKTELCNKWEESGSCPYNDRCKFAHGLKELRPVLRHPRYKTEVCRMILAGDPCPFGHRCHFRHSLTPKED